MVALFNSNLSFRSLALRALLLLLILYIAYKLIDIGQKAAKVWSLNSTATQIASQLNYPVFEFATNREGIVRLLALGDTGSHSPEQRAVADALEARCQAMGGVDGVLLLGDLIYPNGVESVDDAKWQTHYEDYYRTSPCLSRAMVYPVLGNHDYIGQPVAWLQRAVSHDQWYFPSRSWHRQFADVVTLWGIDSDVPWFGGIEAIADDSTVNSSESGGSESGGGESGSTTKNASSPWRIGLGHHPIESSSLRGGRHKGGGLAGRTVRDSMCGSVDLYLSGHAHHMEHRHLSQCDLDVLVVGSGGAGLQGVDEANKDALFVAGQFGFAELEISQAKIDIRLFNRDGDKVYGYTKMEGGHNP